MNESKRYAVVSAAMASSDDGTPGIGLVDRQNGGRGQYARVDVSARPAANPNDVNRIESAVVGASIPTHFLSAVVDGCEAGLKHGPVGGYPVTGVIVTIVGGKAHEKDSDAGAFEEAGRLAVQAALSSAPVTLMEPIATLETTGPSEYFGALLGDIARRRGQIVETDGDGEISRVRATVPLAEMFGYATDLRSMTQGRGTFTLEPSGYAPV